jgi:hypothetical protein
MNAAFASPLLLTAALASARFARASSERPPHHQIVNQAREVPSAHRGWQIGQCKRLSASIDAHVGRNSEHPGDAEPDLSLLLGWKRLTQRRVHERPGLVDSRCLM